MIAFALAVCLLLITPGPGVLSLAGVGAASVGTILHYNDKGFVELDRESFRQNPAPEFVTACRLSGPASD